LRTPVSDELELALVARAVVAVGATAEELDAVGDDRVARALAAVLRLPLRETGAAADGDLAPLAEVLCTGLGLAAEGGDVDVDRALIAAAALGEAKLADLLAVRALELRILGQATYQGDAVHLILLPMARAGPFCHRCSRPRREAARCGPRAALCERAWRAPLRARVGPRAPRRGRDAGARRDSPPGGAHASWSPPWSAGRGRRCGSWSARWAPCRSTGGATRRRPACRCGGRPGTRRCRRRARAPRSPPRGDRRGSGCAPPGGAPPLARERRGGRVRRPQGRRTRQSRQTSRGRCPSSRWPRPRHRAGPSAGRLCRCCRCDRCQSESRRPRVARSRAADRARARRLARERASAARTRSRPGSAGEPADRRPLDAHRRANPP